MKKHETLMSGKLTGRPRSGLSLMEVLFAIGVLTVGILGIASVLPVATNNASKTLQRDKGIEEVNNTIAAEVARIGDQLDSVFLANNSAVRHALPANNPSHLPRYFEFALRDLPNAVCIDPWFLTAASNLRDDSGPDTTRNGYDRTQFPCYDTRFNPFLSPSLQIQDSVNTSGAVPDDWVTPRFTRVAVPFPEAAAAPSFQAKQSNAREVDNLSLFQPQDTTFPPGLFVQRAAASGALAKTLVSGRYSSFVMLSRAAPGSNIFNSAIVTLLDREVRIVNRGQFGVPPAVPTAPNAMAFALQPYTAAAPDQLNPGDDELTYADEVMGYVTFAPRPFVGGGGGEFVYRHSANMSPRVRAGDWLMLARQEYAPGPTGLAIKFAWYQVRSVVQAPTLISGPPLVYETRVSVRGPDWVFHPSQVYVPGLGFAPPYTPTTTPAAANPPSPQYDYVNKLRNQRFGTIVVLMPKVISVYQSTLRL